MKKKVIYEQLNRQYADSLDSRYKFATRDKLQDYLENEETSYTGQMVYIEDEGNLYILDVSPSVNEETKEEEYTVKLHEVMLVDKLDNHLLQSQALKNTIDKVYKDVQKGIDDIESSVENTVKETAASISQLSGNIAYILNFLKEKYPDDFKTEEPKVDETTDGTFNESEELERHPDEGELTGPPDLTDEFNDDASPVNMEE